MADEADLLGEHPLASLLAAYDEHLAAGAAPPSLPEHWQQDGEVLRLMDRLLRRAPAVDSREEKGVRGEEKTPAVFRLTLLLLTTYWVPIQAKSATNCSAFMPAARLAMSG